MNSDFASVLFVLSPQLGRIDTSSVGFRLPSLCHLSSLHVLQLGIGGMVDGVAETIGSGLPLLRCLQLTTTRPLGQSGTPSKHLNGS